MKTVLILFYAALGLAACSVDYQPELARAMHDIEAGRACDLGFTPVLLEAETIPKADWVNLDTGYVPPNMHWYWVETRGKFIIYHPALYIGLNKEQRRTEFRRAIFSLSIPCK